MSSRTDSPLLPVGSLLLSMLSFQFGAALAKQLFPLVGAQGATALRLGLGAVILWLIRRPWRHLAGRRDWISLWGYGLTLGVMNLCFYMALRTIPLGIAVALEFLGPLSIALLGSRRALDFVWVGLVVAGLALLLPYREQAGALDPVGVMYALGAAVGWATYIVLGRRAGAAFGKDAVALGSAIGALVVVPVGVAHAGSALFSLSALPFAIGVAVLSSALPYSLEMHALTRLARAPSAFWSASNPRSARCSGCCSWTSTSTRFNGWRSRRSSPRPPARWPARARRRSRPRRPRSAT